MNEVYEYIVAHHEELSTIGLAVIFVARLIAALTPSKRDDEVAGAMDKGFRRVVELVSGAGHRNLVTPAEAPVEEGDLSEIDQFRQVLKKQFNADLKIVVKE